MLRPWRPATANVDDWREPPKLAVPGHGALVMDVDPEPPEAQAFGRAAERAGMATSLFETDRRLAGYDWYDGLDRVACIATHVAIGGKEYPLEDFPLPERTGSSAAALPSRPETIRPETIRMDLAVRPMRGPDRTLDLPADLAFAGEPWGWLGDAIPLVTAESGLQPHQLSELLRAGFFPARGARRTASRCGAGPATDTARAPPPPLGSILPPVWTKVPSTPSGPHAQGRPVPPRDLPTLLQLPVLLARLLAAHRLVLPVCAPAAAPDQRAERQLHFSEGSAVRTRVDLHDAAVIEFVFFCRPPDEPSLELHDLLSARGIAFPRPPRPRFDDLDPPQPVVADDVPLALDGEVVDGPGTFVRQLLLRLRKPFLDARADVETALPVQNVGRRADWTPIGALTSCFLLTYRGQYRALLSNRCLSD